MSTSTDRGRVLRAGSTGTLQPARMDAPLGTSPFAAGGLAIDPRLTAPHLQQILADAVCQATVRAQADGFSTGQAHGLAAATDRAARQARLDEQDRQSQEDRRQDEHAAALQTLLRAAEAFRTAEATGVAQIEDVVVDLALRLARAVLDRELAVSASPGAEALARALKLAPPGAEVVARLNPADLIGVSSEQHPGVTLVGDPGVEPGGCIAEGAGRRIDAQIREALARAAAVLS